MEEHAHATVCSHFLRESIKRRVPAFDADLVEVSLDARHGTPPVTVDDAHPHPAASHSPRCGQAEAAGATEDERPLFRREFFHAMGRWCASPIIRRATRSAKFDIRGPWTSAPGCSKRM